jgi:hypothetical protein
MSVGPPAAKGTTIRTGWVGQAACAAAPRSPSAGTASAPPPRARR